MLDGYVRRVTGVHPNTKCARCKITAFESVKLEPFATSIFLSVFKGQQALLSTVS